MKRIFCLLLGLLCGLCLFASCKGDEPEPNTISYYVVVDGVKKEVPVEYKLENGNYPVSYEEGNGNEENVKEILKIDYLVAEYEVEGGTLLFRGWYLDEACTMKFDGIFNITTGDLTLYGKYVTESDPVVSDIVYKAVIGESVESLDDLPDKMLENVSLPDTYTEGAIVSIGNLKDYSGTNVEYEFKGWFTDAACTVAFTEITLETKGDITLYAKIDYSTWSPFL